MSIGTALLIAPRPVGALCDVDDERLGRVLGATDVACAFGHIFATSSGAMAVHAAAAGVPIDRLVILDVPYVMGGVYPSGRSIGSTSPQP